MNLYEEQLQRAILEVMPILLNSAKQSEVPISAIVDRLHWEIRAVSLVETFNATKISTTTLHSFIQKLATELDVRYKYAENLNKKV